MATGAVVVTQNSTSNGTAMIAGNVTVTGGSTVDITANMTNTATAGNANNITAGAYVVTASNTTTAVTITQNVTATDLAATTVAGTAETSVVTFGALAAGESVAISAGTQTISGAASADLCFTASKALNAAEVAAAFASLTSADTQANGGIVANGYFTGALDAGWTTVAASGATVTFTATSVGNQGSEITVNTDATADWSSLDNAAAASATAFVVSSKTDGTSASTTVAAQNVTADFCTVAVQDNATASITTITLDGYDTATLGTAGSLDALTTLNLSNSSGTNTLRTAKTSLTMNLDGITGATTVDHTAATITDLTINTSGTASSFGLTAAAMTDLTIGAGANLTITPTSIAALETLTVTGAGNVTMGDISTATTTITAGSANGAISASVDGDIATVTTGSGNDTITLLATDVFDEDINLGAGNDTLVLTAGSTVLPTGTVDGGADTDTISMTTASAESYDASTNFASALTSFERLTISNATSATIEAKNLGFNYVTFGGAATGTLNDVAANSTTVFEAATNNASIVLDDATGGTDVANVVVNNKAVNSAAVAYAVYTLDLVGAATNDDGDTITFGNGGVSGTYTEAGGGSTATEIATAMIATGTITIDSVVYNVTAGSNATSIVLTDICFYNTTR